MTRFILLIFSLLSIFLQAQSIERTEPFFSDWTEIKNDKTISWYYLNVPENYKNPNGKIIKLAITVLHSPTKKNVPTLFINGGPGGGAIDGLWRWLKHPLREISDIILIDIRGTGYSTPRLCPELGDQLFKVLAKNQKSERDEIEKINLALDCKKNLVNNGIDIDSYNNESVSNDLHSLKLALNINRWNVLSVSYGTVFSQYYSTKFFSDINKLIIDAGISNVDSYYAQNFKNYTESLQKVCDECKNNYDCNKKYPDLKITYNSVLKKLEKRPLKVNLRGDSKLKSFTYNPEDFKIAIQQSLYNPQIIPLLPHLIYSFKNEDSVSVSRFTALFGRALKLDYGTYYCFTCNSLNVNNIKLDENYLSFYKADIDICSRWQNKKNIKFLLENKSNNIDILIFSGKYDPITPLSFSKLISDNYLDKNIIMMNGFSHGSSSSVIGNNIITSYLTNNVRLYNKYKTEGENSKIAFIYINPFPGITDLIENINSNPEINLIPFVLSLIMMIYLIVYIIFLNKKKLLHYLAKINLTLGILYLIFIVLVILKTTNTNNFILLLGIEECYYLYISIFTKFYFITMLVTLCYIFLQLRRERNTLNLLIFSNLILNIGIILFWKLI